MENNSNKLKQMWVNFNEQRTDFFKSAGFVFLEAIIPGIAIWVLLGDDFLITMNTKLPSPTGGYVSLVCVLYLCYTILITYLFYKAKFHKADNFTYSITFNFILISVIATSYIFHRNDTTVIIAKFVIALAIGIIGITVGVFLTYIFRVLEFGRKLKLEQNLEAYNEGTLTEQRLINRAIKYQKYLDKLAEKQKLIDQKAELLQHKIDEEYELEKAKERMKKISLSEKLDLKEQKQREKAKKKEDKKNRIKF
ncbi:hypothetical protein SHELI_v1c03770 [Spiroplasma helicoides]|uniref:Uncharacterized protein n=1 Tax=Spiroplasma helicoides TaxID=216938 RepID=A0A1B3SK74_9MOLU|nr:hypothetical protein [Spiroplasma helicoides]AOG60330.1 hypothetical protein SHELI_v1c03770 [Spiroplasma helicoides]